MAKAHKLPNLVIAFSTVGQQILIWECSAEVWFSQKLVIRLWKCLVIKRKIRFTIQFNSSWSDIHYTSDINQYCICRQNLHKFWFLNFCKLKKTFSKTAQPRIQWPWRGSLEIRGVCCPLHCSAAVDSGGPSWRWLTQDTSEKRERIGTKDTLLQQALRWVVG